jgi:hypothetical protein
VPDFDMNIPPGTLNSIYHGAKYEGNSEKNSEKNTEKIIKKNYDSSNHPYPEYTIPKMTPYHQPMFNLPTDEIDNQFDEKDDFFAEKNDNSQNTFDQINTLLNAEISNSLLTNEAIVSGIIDPYVTIATTANPGLNRALTSLYSRPFLTLPVYTPPHTIPIEDTHNDDNSLRNGNYHNYSYSYGEINNIHNLPHLNPNNPHPLPLTRPCPTPHTPDTHIDIDNIYLPSNHGIQQSPLPQLFCHVFITKNSTIQRYTKCCLIQSDEKPIQNPFATDNPYVYTNFTNFVKKMQNFVQNLEKMNQHAGIDMEMRGNDELRADNLHDIVERWNDERNDKNNQNNCEVCFHMLFDSK